MCHVPDSFDLAFKLRRKKMTIEVSLQLTNVCCCFFNLILASLISKRFEVSLVLLISWFDLLLVSIETSPSPRSLRNSEQDARGRCPRKTWFSLVPVHALKQSPWLLIIHPAHCMWRVAFKVNIEHIFLSVILCNKVIIICYLIHL